MMCIIIAIIELIIQNDWNTLVIKPKDFVRELPLIVSSRNLLNDLLGIPKPRTISSAQTGLKARIRKIVANRFHKKTSIFMNKNDLHQMIDDYMTAFNSNHSSTTYTYENVGNNYSGPIVDGWPPVKSREVSRYISTQPALNKLNSNCSQVLMKSNLLSIDGELELLIMQHSAPDHFEARQSSRNTWMKLLKV